MNLGPPAIDPFTMNFISTELFHLESTAESLCIETKICLQYSFLPIHYASRLGNYLFKLVWTAPTFSNTLQKTASSRLGLRTKS